MEIEKEYIEVSTLLETLDGTSADMFGDFDGDYRTESGFSRAALEELIKSVTKVDVVEVAKVEETKEQLLKIVDEFIEEYKSIRQSYVDHFGGKVDAMETARRLINASLTDLCRKD